MVQVRQSTIQPQLGSADYSQMTKAVMRGLDQQLLASKEKNARIRASLAEVKLNNKASSDAQASWMGALDSNPELLEALNTAPPRIQTAYKKATQGRATLEDNSVISSYLNSIAKGQAAQRAIASEQLVNEVNRAKINQSNAAQLASLAQAEQASNKAKLDLAEFERGDPEANQRNATIQALLAGRTPSMQSPQMRTAPPANVINTSDPNDPVSRPVQGLALPEPQPVTAAPQAPAAPTGNTLIDNNPFAPQTSAETTPSVAPAEQPVNPDMPFFTDAKGNRVVATPQAINSPEVIKLMEKGVDQGTAIEIVQANFDLGKKKSEYVMGIGNNQNLPTPEVYTARLVAAGNDLDDAREQTTAAIAQGIVYSPPTTAEMTTRSKEFDEAFEKESASLSNLLSDTQTVQNAAERVKDNLGFFTSGTLASWTSAIGLDYMPLDGKSNIEMKKALGQLTSDASLSTMEELKKASKQGATGLGQVSVVEFTSLKEKKSSIEQSLQSGDLEESVDIYVYDRNKLAYKAYKSMVDSYGLSAVNSRTGISEKQVANILRDIDNFERLDPIGISIAARTGYFIDNEGLPTARSMIEPGFDPLDDQQRQEDAKARDEERIAAGEAAFQERERMREGQNVKNKQRMAKTLAKATMPVVPGTVIEYAPQVINMAPKIIDFFGGNPSNTQQYNSNSSLIQTK